MPSVAWFPDVGVKPVARIVRELHPSLAAYRVLESGCGPSRPGWVTRPWRRKEKPLGGDTWISRPLDGERYVFGYPDAPNKGLDKQPVL
mgnify:CR=1 FL=1